jgi:hypothetical protein
MTASVSMILLYKKDNFYPPLLTTYGRSCAYSYFYPQPLVDNLKSMWITFIIKLIFVTEFLHFLLNDTP